MHLVQRSHASWCHQHTEFSVTPKAIPVLLLSMIDTDPRHNFISAISSTLPDALIDQSMFKLCLIVSEMNHRGKQMWIHSTLRLHITHLGQRRNVFYNRVMMTWTSLNTLKLSTYCGFLWCDELSRSKKNTSFIWITIMLSRRILYQGDDRSLVYLKTHLWHTVSNHRSTYDSTLTGCRTKQTPPIF
jgi:hypothetical protein